jgi:putative permease
MQQLTRKNKENTFRLIFFLIIVLTILGLFFSLSRILIPLGIAYILTLMLRPLRKSFYSVSIKKKTISIILTMSIGFMIFYPFAKGIKTVGDEAHKVEYYAPKLERYLREKYHSFRKEVKTRFNYEIKTDPVDKLVEFGQENTKSLFVYLPVIVASLLEWGFIIPLFLFFMLKDGRAVRFQFLKLVPNSIVERTYYLFHQFNTKFGDYIFAKFIEAAIVGTIITTGLLIIDYPFAFLLGLVAAITNILPYIGPFLGFIPALVVGLVDQNPNTTLGAMAVLYIVANVIDLALVFPILVSKIVNLHPMVVVISVILGSQFAGIIGMIVSIPMAAFVKLLFVEIYRELYTNPYA